MNSCVISSSRLDSQQADLVLFKDHFTKPSFSRPTNQLWMMYFLECPLHTQNIRQKNMFNWTSTYRSDSTLGKCRFKNYLVTVSFGLIRFRQYWIVHFIILIYFVSFKFSCSVWAVAILQWQCKAVTSQTKLCCQQNQKCCLVCFKLRCTKRSLKICQRTSKIYWSRHIWLVWNQTMSPIESQWLFQNVRARLPILFGLRKFKLQRLHHRKVFR